MFNSRPFSFHRQTIRSRRNTGAAEYSPSQEAVRRQHPKYSFADNVQAMMAMYQGYGLVGHGGSAWNWGIPWNTEYPLVICYSLLLKMAIDSEFSH